MQTVVRGKKGHETEHPPLPKENDAMGAEIDAADIADMSHDRALLKTIITGHITGIE